MKKKGRTHRREKTEIKRGGNQENLLNKESLDPRHPGRKKKKRGKGTRESKSFFQGGWLVWNNEKIGTGNFSIRARKKDLGRGGGSKKLSGKGTGLGSMDVNRGKKKREGRGKNYWLRKMERVT